MFIELRHVIQWAHNPKNARDPRLQFFAALKNGSSVDPFSFSLTKKENNILVAQGRYTFLEINLSALRRKKLETHSKTKQFEIELKDWDKETVKINLPVQSLFQISLEDAFICWQFYIILMDKNKLKKLETLIKE